MSTAESQVDAQRDRAALRTELPDYDTTTKAAAYLADGPFFPPTRACARLAFGAKAATTRGDRVCRATNSTALTTTRGITK
jgi:hypothetical protein